MLIFTAVTCYLWICWTNLVITIDQSVSVRPGAGSEVKTCILGVSLTACIKNERLTEDVAPNRVAFILSQYGQQVSHANNVSLRPVVYVAGLSGYQSMWLLCWLVVDKLDYKLVWDRWVTYRCSIVRPEAGLFVALMLNLHDSAVFHICSLSISQASFCGILFLVLYFNIAKNI